MLEAADVAVVMGNALPQVRAYADYVTDKFMKMVKTPIPPYAK